MGGRAAGGRIGIRLRFVSDPIDIIEHMSESRENSEVTPEQVDSWITALMRASGPTADAACIDLIRALERLTCSADGLKAGATATFARLQRGDAHLSDEKRERIDRSIATQIGLARRESPRRARTHVGLAAVLTTEMPHTYTALRTGRITEWRATVIVRETACLTREDRGKIDAEIGADPQHWESLSEGRLIADIRARAYEMDREHFVLARERAVKGRRVTLRPLPDGMARLSATVPVVDGVAAYVGLEHAAMVARSEGDERSRGAIMADTLLERLRSGNGPGTAPAVPIAVNLLVSDSTLLGDGDEAAQCENVGPVPADLARDLVATASDADLATLRRVYGSPGSLVAMESRARCFPAGLARLIRLRDRTCRMPFCDAPIRHIDHVVPAARGGPTSFTNGQGLCESCNHAKQPNRWYTRVRHRPDGRHEVVTTTPTGHNYRSPAPPPPRASPPSPPRASPPPPARESA